MKSKPFRNIYIFKFHIYLFDEALFGLIEELILILKEFI